MLLSAEYLSSTDLVLRIGVGLLYDDDIPGGAAGGWGYRLAGFDSWRYSPVFPLDDIVATFCDSSFRFLIIAPNALVRSLSFASLSF